MRVGGAQAVRRAIEVVRTVAQIQRSGASLSRVAMATGFSTPTAYRLLRSLTEERLLIYDEKNRYYYVGPLAFELGLAALPETRVDLRWSEIVNNVASRTRLTSYLIAQSNDEAVCLLCAQGSAAIRAMPMEVGQRVPLGIGAGSLVILSSLADEEISQILEAHKDRYGVFPGGAQDQDQILRRISTTRKRGFSISTGTVASGVTGIGVLATSEGSVTRMAVTVSAVASTFSAAEAASLASIIRSSVNAQPKMVSQQ